jgi:hypothetical protein
MWTDSAPWSCYRNTSPHSPAVMLPALSDLQALLRRLALDERDRVRELARLEDRLRRFEDIERPAYVRWRRLTFGPALSALQELYAEVEARRALARRVIELVERRDLRPREALYVATHGTAPEMQREDADRDSIEARRRAKRERKRDERRRTSRAQRASNATPRAHADGETSRRIVTLYRALARRLHPDSATAIRSLNATRVRAVWTEVQSAYEARSLERMLAISAWLETAEEHGSEVPPAAPLLSLDERHERLRALARSCRALERRLAELERDPAWAFDRTPDATRRRLEKEVARDIDDELVRLREAAGELDGFFGAIGSPRPPRSDRGR